MKIEQSLVTWFTYFSESSWSPISNGVEISCPAQFVRHDKSLCEYEPLVLTSKNITG